MTNRKQYHIKIRKTIVTDRDRIKLLEAECLRLFKLLDHIDTLGDACRENDAQFRELTHKYQRKRFDGGITTDGYKIDLSGIRILKIEDNQKSRLKQAVGKARGGPAPIEMRRF